MSWDGYIDSIMAKSVGAVTKATIIGLNGAIWTPPVPGTEKVITISQTEASTIAVAMAKKDDTVKDTFVANGIMLGGVKYMFLRDLDNDGRIMTAKKVGVGALTLQSTKQAIIIAWIPDAQAHAVGNANKAVESIAKYLEDAGY